MSKLFFGSFLLLSVVCSDAFGDWVRLNGNDKMTSYADSSSLRVKGNIVRISSLFDFKIENTLSDGSVYLSTVRESEFNCRENLQRMVGYSIFSGRMGRGTLLDSATDPQDWKPVSKSSVAIGMKEYACRSN